ncbi:hypothetical protein CLAVI_000221 [Candidatus Clavichlamydia salmonicola]|uniref:hypothetical protein n=1 Tax=Candidatus Clavichlamydia salmonicola TaxID=469812 RepID=UPI001890D131|nr:hypothetical protein [Candidatus Clavichlamydia salmonicola]MBF5050609.1 hypothetical protein [Candidatus Clavichlamydia salmonicola]
MKKLKEDENFSSCFYSKTHVSIETNDEPDKQQISEKAAMLYEIESQMAAMQETVTLACSIGNLLKNTIKAETD